MYGRLKFKHTGNSNNKENNVDQSPSKKNKSTPGKTESFLVQAPQINLPKGGGAIKSIDEKFLVNAVNGTSSFSVPIPFSPARGFSPSLTLNYNSGSGNGLFGLGWTLSLSSVKRKTENELPRYLDDIDSDTFVFSGCRGPGTLGMDDVLKATFGSIDWKKNRLTLAPQQADFTGDEVNGWSLVIDKDSPVFAFLKKNKLNKVHMGVVYATKG